MDIIKTGMGITRTIKNVARLREIIAVLGKNGFDEFIIKSKLDEKIPGFVLPKYQESIDYSTKGLDVWESIGLRLRRSFEELGPSFIKLGQLLATREDLFHQGFVKELKLLQSKAIGIDFNDVEVILNRNLGQDWHNIFSEFDKEPIGMASIGVVYKAKLKNGDDVVVKVRRPRVKKLILNDFEIISFIIGQFEKASEDLKYLGISRAIDDFFKSIQLELNFLIEAQNAEKFANNIAKHDSQNLFKIPKIYKEFSSEEIMTMEFIHGRAFNSFENITIEAPELNKKLIEAVKIFIKSMLADGHFHADLHGGNFFLMPNGQVGIIDFGLMGSLGRKGRMSLVAILYALVSNNYENLVFEFLDIAEYDGVPNCELLIKDVQDAISPFMGLDVQDIDATFLVHALVTTLRKHQLHLPRDWFIIFRALMTLDGVGKALKVKINIFEVIDSEIKDIVGSLISKETMTEELLWAGRDALNSFKFIPRHIRWMLKEFAKKQYVFEIRMSGIEKEMKTISRGLAFMGLQIPCSTLLFSGVTILKDMGVVRYNDIPSLVWVFWGIGSLLFIQSLSLLRNKN